ncbi:hypothetical protein ABIE44_000062 [Marmoricola sp. OAE513]|uniref:hypothetical protein n=1 Tax=Marmoricola sp. OAE513 TaxID=2817894 RepID=UPI001AE60776
MRGFGAALLIGALLLTSGCGGEDEPEAKKPATSKAADPNSGVRPSVKDLATALQKAEQADGKPYTKKQAICIASILEASKVSNDGLRQAIANPGSYAPSDADATVVKGLIGKVSACLIDELRTPSPTS